METLSSAEPLLLQRAVINDDTTSYSADSSYCHVESTTPDDLYYDEDADYCENVYATPYYQCADDACSMLQYGPAFVDDSVSYVATGRSSNKRS